MQPLLNIVFICGSLEPGRDGVGDYTRRLCTALQEKGHTTGIIAINDQQLAEVFEGEQSSGLAAVPVLRLPSAMPLAQRFELAGTWIKKADPQWMSLQFVPFAFDPKGLPRKYGRLLAQLGSGRNWHVMVHELWVGMDKQSAFKFVVWGWLQRQVIRSVFNALAPKVIHTQTGLYLQLLKNLGYKAAQLPLFGNIPVLSAGKTGSPGQIASDNTIYLVVFGGIHPGAPIDQLAKEAKQYSNNTGVMVVLRMLGRCGSEQPRWEQAWTSEGLPIEILGEQSIEKISTLLSSADFGLSTTPAVLVEKSGSVAAMREHGLPVLCIAREWVPRGMPHMPLPEGIEAYEPGKLSSFFTGNNNAQHAIGLSAIADRFIHHLTSPV